MFNVAYVKVFINISEPSLSGRLARQGEFSPEYKTHTRALSSWY